MYQEWKRKFQGLRHREQTVMLITLGLFILFPVAGWTPVLLFWIFDLDCACTAETSPAARKVFRGLMRLLGVLAASNVLYRLARLL